MQNHTTNLDYIPSDENDTDLFTKSFSSVKLKKSLMLSKKKHIYLQHSKHVDMKYHFIGRDMQNLTTKLEYISLEENNTYLLTKSFSRVKLKKSLML